MREGVDGHDDPHVLAEDVEGRTYRHRVDRVVFAGDGLRRSDDAVDRDVEAMVVLRRQAEDAERAVHVALGVGRIGVSEQARDRELAALDPDGRRVVDAVEDDGPAIRRRDDDLGVVGGRARPRLGLQPAIEELVERLELAQRQEDVGGVELVEGDEARNLTGRGRIVELAALLDAERLEQLADCIGSNKD